MDNGMTRRKWMWGGALGVVALGAAVASGTGSSGFEASETGSHSVAAYQHGDAAPDGANPAAPHAGFQRSGYAPQDGAEPGPGVEDDAQQALEGLAQIRQQQCQMGNQLACQTLSTFPGVRNQLAQFGQTCRSGDRSGCEAYQQLAQRIYTAYSESASVMRAGEQGMAQMDAWRGQMNRNAANSMANLQARAAAGQAAHDARQESYATMNRSWAAGQESMDRSHGRFIDGIYEGTTMDGGGVQSRVPNGSVGYTDGRGNVVAVPEGTRPPDGWQRMNPTYATPR